MIANRERGFTAVELLIVLSIITVLATVSSLAFKSMRDAQAIVIAADNAGHALRSARNATLASLAGSVYGVRFESSRVVRFTGSTYASSSASNIAYQFPGGITAAYSFTGGVAQVTFARLTGEASATGTILFSDAQSGATSSLMIAKTGLIDLDR